MGTYSRWIHGFDMNVYCLFERQLSVFLEWLAGRYWVSSVLESSSHVLTVLWVLSCHCETCIWHTYIYIYTSAIKSQGAVIGLAAGLVMAFWIGIGGFLARMSIPVEDFLLNSTDIKPDVSDNITATIDPVHNKSRWGLYCTSVV